MLIDALKAIVNKQFQESFGTNFMGNRKNYQNINDFFPFPIKLF